MRQRQVEIRRRERLQLQRQAARADRWQQPPRRVRQHQEKRPLRRLLEDLQDRIGGVAVEIVGRIDDCHAPVAGARCLAEELAGPAHLVDGDDGLCVAGLLVHRTRQVQHIVRRAACDLAADRVVKVRIGDAVGSGQRVGMRQHVMGKPVGQCRLADATRPSDHPCMGQPVAFKGVAQRRLRRGMTDEIGIGARRRR